MLHTENLCYNCFREKKQEGICPYCGYNNIENMAKFPRAMKEGSILSGQYIIGRVLGQGGFGITYLALDYQLDIKVAIKEYLPDGMATRLPGTTLVSIYEGEKQDNFYYGAERFLDEARVLAKFIGNKNIVSVKSYFNENNTSYFVMDYIEGINFKNYIKKCGGKITYQDALRVLLPVADALAQIHREGFIHRDVTPDNIYITKDNEIKLLDFGSARYSLGDKSKSLDVILKAGYAPKEQYIRKGKQGPYTDIYSLCACFYASITGYLPPESLERMENDEIIPISTRGIHIPDSLDYAIMKGLEVRAEDRFQTIYELTTIIMGNSKQDNLQDVQQKMNPPLSVRGEPIPSPKPYSIQPNLPYSEPNHVPFKPSIPYAIPKTVPNISVTPYPESTPVPNKSTTPYQESKTVPNKYSIPNKESMQAPVISATPYSEPLPVPNNYITPYSEPLPTPNMSATPYTEPMQAPNISTLPYSTSNPTVSSTFRGTEEMQNNNSQLITESTSATQSQILSNAEKAPQYSSIVEQNLGKKLKRSRRNKTTKEKHNKLEHKPLKRKHIVLLAAIICELILLITYGITNFISQGDSQYVIPSSGGTVNSTSPAPLNNMLGILSEYKEQDKVPIELVIDYELIYFNDEISEISPNISVPIEIKQATNEEEFYELTENNYHGNIRSISFGYFSNDFIKEATSKGATVKKSTLLKKGYYVITGVEDPIISEIINEFAPVEKKIEKKAKQEAAKKEAERQEKARLEKARKEELRKEAVKDEAKLEEAKKEEAKKEEAKKEEAKKEEARKEEARKEAARKEAARQEAAEKAQAKKEAAEKAKCDYCNGTGKVACTWCDGTGKAKIAHWDEDGEEYIYVGNSCSKKVVCSWCKGTGKKKK